MCAFDFDAPTRRIFRIHIIDYESVSLYSIQASASDDGVPSLTTAVTVQIYHSTDVNDNSPVFSKDLYKFKVIKKVYLQILFVGVINAND